ncbi:MAG TPA: zinc-binding dehydrogenase [Casimicrobiaceae bacterium]|nr:zinc-binding dehydrogenase [Casimicrobiaceae bacterium]
MMKAVLMTAPGAVDVLEFTDVPVPALTDAHQMLVRVFAAGVNPVDTKVRKSHFYYPENLPAILGCDGAGTVEAVGSAVTRFRPGDDVYFFNNGLGGAPGSYAQYTVVDEAHAARKPARLSMVEAAAIPLALITAWEALVDRSALQRDEYVLVHGGAGGVGHLAVQLAHHRGARVAPTVSNNDKGRFVRELGAERTIDYRKQDFVDAVLEWTNGHGADVILDTVGGATFCRSFRALRLYGRITTLLSTACELADVNEARLRNVRVGYVQMTAPSFLGDADARVAQARILENAAALFDDGTLKVAVTDVLPLARASDAHRLVEEGHTLGKVVLEIDRP